MQGVRPEYTYSEKDWNLVTYDQAESGHGGTAYCASKTFAEKAAWGFVKAQKPNFHLATICPPKVYGPWDHDASLDHNENMQRRHLSLHEWKSEGGGANGFSR